MKYVLLALCAFGCVHAQDSHGAFEGAQDVGSVLHRGSARFDEKSRAYTLSGSGVNMWGTTDAFHYLWKKASGDVMITADIEFPSKGGDAHKKAALIIRQTLDADSAYADAALHGDGLTSLQSRETAGAATHEIQANVTAPRRLRLEKRGSYFSISFAKEGGELQMAGGAMKVPITGEFYIGLGVCAHNKDNVETATFSNVEITPIPASTAQPKLYSTLETINVASTDRRVAQVVPDRIEAPNWTPDGASLIYNGGGLLYRIPVAGARRKSSPRALRTV